MNEVFFEALSFAATCHHDQRRKASSDPYINHPIRVAYLAIDSGLSMECAVAALLHDVVEDCGMDMETIVLKYGPNISNIVRLLTKTWENDQVTPDQQQINKRNYYDGIMSNIDAVHVKLLDRIDNLKDMASDLPNKSRWASKYLAKTIKEVDPIYEKATNEAIKTLYVQTKNDLSRKLK